MITTSQFTFVTDLLKNQIDEVQAELLRSIDEYRAVAVACVGYTAAGGVGWVITQKRADREIEHIFTLLKIHEDGLVNRIKYTNDIVTRSLGYEYMGNVYGSIERLAKSTISGQQDLDKAKTRDAERRAEEQERANRRSEERSRQYSSTNTPFSTVNTEEEKLWEFALQTARNQKNQGKTVRDLVKVYNPYNSELNEKIIQAFNSIN